METETILITRADGGVSVMSFVVYSDLDGVRREPTDANIDEAIAKGGESVLSWRRIQRDELPGRDYRDAWTDVDGAVTHDLDKAREIHRGRLRMARAPLLAALDVEAIRATESGDQAALALVAARKQVLRDLPADPRIDAATTVEDLAAVTFEPVEPDVVKRKHRRRTSD